MPTASIYLNFNGQCRQAMEFYKNCLGGELYLQTVGDSALAGSMLNLSRQVMHSSLTVGSFNLLASDMHRDALTTGNTLSIVMDCDSAEQISTFFTNLSAGGQVIDALQDSFWNATYGMLRDKFGVQWIFNFDKSKNS